LKILQTRTPLNYNDKANKHRTPLLDWRIDLVGHYESIGNPFYGLSNQEFRIFFLSRLWIGSFHFFPFHGQIKESFHHHPLGAFALVVIFLRILKLIKNSKFLDINN